jgi:hypothetical protein
VCSQEIWVSDPNIAKWCGKLQHFSLRYSCESQKCWKMGVHLVILEGCIPNFFLNSSACETGIHWNLRLEPFAGVVLACISHAIFLYETDAFCFRKWRVVAMGSTKCLFVDVFRQNPEVVCGLNLAIMHSEQVRHQ